MPTINFNWQIDPIALYAAVVGTLSLLGTLYLWWTRGPSLVGRIAPNMVGFGFLENDRTKDKIYVVVTVENRGTEPTTITSLALIGYSSIWKQFRRRPSFGAVVNPSVPGYPLPGPLAVGHEWKGAVIQNDELVAKSHTLRLFVVIAHSFSDKPFLIRVQPITPPRTRAAAEPGGTQ